jgi:alpha-D-ribose 1-methylphosphonate 5-triphosphate synthase subunit PhnG
MEILSLSPTGELERIFNIFKLEKDPLVLRAPESGLIMARGRIAGTGSPFNLGELFLSRTAVSILGFVGYGYCLCQSPYHAYLAACLDSLAQNPSYAELVEKELSLLQLAREKEIEKESRKTDKTKVEFFTLVRGDD